VSPIPDLILNDGALGDARMRLAEAAVPVIPPASPTADAAFASAIVADALAELCPVLLGARTSLAVVAAGMSTDLGVVADTFAAVDAQLAGELP
jgi:hypothetical protein